MDAVERQQMTTERQQATRSAERREPPLEVVPLRHPWRWASAVLLVAALLWVSWRFATSPNIDWGTIGHYLFSEQILKGLALTIALTVLVMLTSMLLGTAVALMRLSENPVLRAVGWLYTWIGRAIPPLVVILLWFNLAIVFPRLGVGGLSADTNTVLTPFVAAVIGLTLSEAPYIGEIVRGGLLSVDGGQREAAEALGMRDRSIVRRIVLPQAMRAILPPLGNELVTVLKTTSLVSVIAAQELLTSAQSIYTVTYEVVELLTVATLWYIVLTSIAMAGQRRLELRFARGMTR
jgi:polar amino acid transport system permease protein